MTSRFQNSGPPEPDPDPIPSGPDAGWLSLPLDAHRTIKNGISFLLMVAAGIGAFLLLTGLLGDKPGLPVFAVGLVAIGSFGLGGFAGWWIGDRLFRLVPVSCDDCGGLVVYEPADDEVYRCRKCGRATRVRYIAR
jgi:hypothetical protein